jgi:hypothetical protein
VVVERDIDGLALDEHRHLTATPAGDVAQHEAAHGAATPVNGAPQAPQPQRSTPNPEGDSRIVRSVFTARSIDRALRTFERPDPASDPSRGQYEAVSTISTEGWQGLRGGGHTDPVPQGDAPIAGPQPRRWMGAITWRGYRSDPSGWGK